ncbi:hypothetical protein AB1Y20_006608 [Prymnesium parvum]|uniref:Phosphoglycolate phosphatase n=1 Tax=Prymnesium parvum TaxID=97485 RepID=A0AB34IXV8_PRYPA|mmetsp:Transcript_1559/g.3957  ORF Transcript_1559/g.3957 Transcript_1559/m.3957 type:complete len:256 (-) Transcript_1559:283-1050(-)
MLGALLATARPSAIRMAAAPSYEAHQAGVLWDVDGTLVDSTQLAYVATNEVLTSNGYDEVSVADYKFGCRFTTPDRFNVHIGGVEAIGRPEGVELGGIFDNTYVARVSSSTAGLFPGMERLLRSISLAGHPQGCLSNACGDYVRAVVAANELDEKPGERIALFGVVRGADEVPAAKPHPEGLLTCCQALGVIPAASVYIGDSPSDGQAAKAAGMKSVGVLWGANNRESLTESFDVLCEDVEQLSTEIRNILSRAA